MISDDGTIARRYGALTLPHLVIIDRRGRVRGVVRGVEREEVLRRAVGEALGP
jgi:hypothetical protein